MVSTTQMEIKERRDQIDEDAFNMERCWRWSRHNGQVCARTIVSLENAAKVAPKPGETLVVFSFERRRSIQVAISGHAEPHGDGKVELVVFTEKYEPKGRHRHSKKTLDLIEQADGAFSRTIKGVEFKMWRNQRGQWPCQISSASWHYDAWYQDVRDDRESAESFLNHKAHLLGLVAFQDSLIGYRSRRDAAEPASSCIICADLTWDTMQVREDGTFAYCCRDHYPTEEDISRYLEECEAPLPNTERLATR